MNFHEVKFKTYLISAYVEFLFLYLPLSKNLWQNVNIFAPFLNISIVLLLYIVNLAQNQTVNTKRIINIHFAFLQHFFEGIVFGFEPNCTISNSFPEDSCVG